MLKVPGFVAGVEVTGDDWFTDLDPSTGEPFAQVARLGAAEVDLAVGAARAAFQSTVRTMAAETRSRLLLRLADLIRRDADRLAELESRDVGKPLRQAAADVAVCARYFDFYAGALRALHVLELGGKSPNLVFADADLDHAVPLIVTSIVQNCGQTCSAGSRVLVHSSRHDELVARVAQRFEELSIGRGLDDPDVGPLINAKQRDRVAGMVGRATTSARLVSGGTAPDGPGFFFPPTLFDDVPVDSELGQEEVFGPVLAVSTFDTDAEAVAAANATDFALVAAVWTRDVGRAHRLADELRAGQVFVNTYGAGGGIELPFGGWKRSGYGREKGFEGLVGYTQTKTVVIGV